MFVTPAWDQVLFTWINTRHAPAADWLMLAVSEAWLAWALGGLILALYVWRKGVRSALPLLLIPLAVGAADFSTKHLKDANCRARPLNTLPHTRFFEDGVWQKRPAGFSRKPGCGSSYPSAHAANTMAAASSVMFLIPQTRPWLLALPAVTGYSRVYLGKHYPTDVLAGWVVGLAWAAFVRMLFMWWRRWRN